MQGQQLRWHWTIQASGVQDNHVCATVCDTAGNIFISGSYADTIRFGSLVLPPYGGQDIFVAKFDPEGVPVWAKSAGSINDDYPTAMAISPAGDIIVAGVSGKNAGFDGFTSGTRKINLFIGAYAPNGDVKWVKSFGAVRNDYIKAITTDNNGNIYFAGYFSRELEFEGAVIESSSLSNALVICLDSLGQPLWAQQFYSEYGENRITALCHYENSLWIAGFCNAPTDIAGTLITPAKEGEVTVFTARCDEHGNVDNVVSVFGAANAEVTSLNISDEGLLILGGNFSEYLNANIISLQDLIAFLLGNGIPIIGIPIILPGGGGNPILLPVIDFPTPSAGITSYGNQDMFLAAMHLPTMTLFWLNQLGSVSYDNLLSMVYHPGYYIIATGLYSSTLMAGKDTIQINNAFCDVFTASYNVLGEIQEVSTMGGTSEEYPQAMTFDKDGNIFVAGLFRDTTNLQNTTLYTPAGTNEVFLAKLHHCNKHRVKFTCDSIFTEGDLLLLGLEGSYAQYVWEHGTSSSPNFLVYYNKTYQVLVSDSIGCVYKDSINIYQIPGIPEWQIRAELPNIYPKNTFDLHHLHLTASRNKEARREDIISDE